jgi:hypothetical protein
MIALALFLSWAAGAATGFCLALLLRRRQPRRPTAEVIRLDEGWRRRGNGIGGPTTRKPAFPPPRIIGPDEPA